MIDPQPGEVTQGISATKLQGRSRLQYRVGKGPIDTAEAADPENAALRQEDRPPRHLGWSPSCWPRSSTGRNRRRARFGTRFSRGYARICEGSDVCRDQFHRRGYGKSRHSGTGGGALLADDRNASSTVRTYDLVCRRAPIKRWIPECRSQRAGRPYRANRAHPASRRYFAARCVRPRDPE
jgi:hypothetical protein